MEVDVKGYNEAIILLAKCPVAHKSYGIRTEIVGNELHSNWAFPLSEEAAQREHFDQSMIKGAHCMTSD